MARNKRKRIERINKAKKQSKRQKLSHLKGLLKDLKAQIGTLKDAKTKYMIMWNKAEEEKNKIKNSKNLLASSQLKSLAVSSSHMANEVLELEHAMFSPYFEGESSIGQGRFGVCKLKKFRGTQVAVKEFKDSEVTMAEVLNEAKFLSTLTHISLPMLFGVITKESPYCIVTQFYGINGKSVTLHAVLLDNSLCDLSKTNIYGFLYQLTDAICYLHAKKVIHNDIKTDNIVVVQESGPIEEYAPVLIDFGKAKRATETKVKRLSEREKAFYRKYHSHIAPEVIDGTHRPSVKSDVFSLGVVMRKLSCVVEEKLEEICSCCLANIKERYNSLMVKQLIQNFTQSR